jgi:hypothetical protein
MRRLPCWCLLEQLRLPLSNQVDVGLEFHTNHLLFQTNLHCWQYWLAGTVKILVWKAGMRNTEYSLLLYHIELYLAEPVRHSYGQNYSHNFPFGLLSTSLLGFIFVECLSELPIAIGYDRFLTVYQTQSLINWVRTVLFLLTLTLY